MTRTVRLVFVVSVLTLVATACGGDSASAPSTTTSAPSTTTSAPTTTTMAAEEPDDASTSDSELSKDDLAFVGALVTAFNMGDLEAYLQLFDPSATATTSLTFGSDLDEYRKELAFVWALNGTWEMGNCEIEYGAISCEIAISRDDLTFIEGPLSAKLNVFVEDGAVRKLALREPTSTIFASTTAFRDWVSENYAESVPAMFFDFPAGIGPKLSDESIALWVELTPRYVESVTE